MDRSDPPQEVAMKCKFCGKTARLANISGHLICQPCNRQVEADTAARIFGGRVPAAVQREWDKTWANNLVAGSSDQTSDSSEPQDWTRNDTYGCVAVIAGIAVSVLFGLWWFLK